MGRAQLDIEAKDNASHILQRVSGRLGILSREGLSVGASIVGVQLAAQGLGAVLNTATQYINDSTDAYRRFGKGRHPAGLNFGDCFSYALAIRERIPLLFKGDDLSKTDVRVAALSPA